ncbi:retropepsin-like aspartic protease family protein [Mesorhizobium sp. L-8-3]|uniref:retropepsin-like aspartic protease family protein n=1 Tax=Mesorhizobium sp. L-8-3 TaxID=2744522 RepID=UPI001926476C|nr:TIGR02281 family clan AA aspartic protease [Mesorhizobium sp. L-8-3]BCH24591.1 aspartic protease [Mesorhizobium sp. L-8-3]
MTGRLFWIGMAAIGGALILLLLSSDTGDSFGSGDDLARVLYLGIWGTVIAAAILGSGMRLGYVARSLALWMLVALILVAGYQYRYELQDIANRVTAGLVPGSPLSIGDDGSTVMLEKAPNGHFQARIEVNGVPVRTIVDTGATATVLTAADARAAGYDPEALSYTIRVSTANGTARAARVTADEITLGTISRRNVPVLVADGGMLDQSLLGMNFIGTLSGFDVRGDRMILRD